MVGFRAELILAGIPKTSNRKKICFDGWRYAWKRFKKFGAVGEVGFPIVCLNVLTHGIVRFSKKCTKPSKPAVVRCRWYLWDNPFNVARTAIVLERE